MAEHFVYLYQSSRGRVVYVGYGRQTRRSMAHPQAGHAEFRKWLKANAHEVRIAGAYRDAEEAKAVEAALISALEPMFNRAPGDGPRFVPLGVPLELAGRARMAPLTPKQIGKRARGALIVYLAPGELLADGRKKFDPSQPVDDDAVRNAERWWQIGNLQDRWAEHPAETPNRLIGVHGRIGHRFIVASLKIDRRRLGDESLRSPRNRARWQVPLVDRTDLDSSGLRGRRVDGVQFGPMSHELHIWVDHDGIVRHPKPRQMTTRGD